MEKFGGRKFIYAVLVTVLGFTLVLSGKVTSEVFLNFVEIIGATYVIGNVATKLSSVIK